MAKRLDGIYKCAHTPMRLNGNKILCSTCSTEIRPSNIPAGGVISIYELYEEHQRRSYGSRGNVSIYIDADRDKFVVLGGSQK